MRMMRREMKRSRKDANGKRVLASWKDISKCASTEWSRVNCAVCKCWL